MRMQTNKYIYLDVSFKSYLFFTMHTKYDIEFLEDATEKLKAIAHPIRFVMVELLAKSSALSVTEIHESLDIEQAVASHHLRILKNQNIVKVVRDGKNSNYSITQPEYLGIVESLVSITKK